MRKHTPVAYLNHFPMKAITEGHINCAVMFSWGSEILCNDEFKNLKTSYSACAALAQSLQVELAKIRGTLCRRYLQPSVFDILGCNSRACNWGDLARTKTPHHEVDTLPFLEVAVFGKGCQTESLLRKSIFWLTYKSKLLGNFQTPTDYLSKLAIAQILGQVRED